MKVVHFLFPVGLVLLYFLCRYSGESETENWNGIDVFGVRKVEWPACGDGEHRSVCDQREKVFLQVITEEREPVIITNCEALEAKKLSTWNVEWISEHIHSLHQVRVQRAKKGFLYYNKERGLENIQLYGQFPNGSVPTIPLRPEFMEKSYSIGQFFSDMNEENKKPAKDKNFMYFSGHASYLGSQMYSRIEKETSNFVVESSQAYEIASELNENLTTEDFTGKHVNLWIGNMGVTAIAHYDTSHNFFFQMYGNKEFVLFPPEQHWNVYLHSFFHPYYRRTQVDIEDIQGCIDRAPLLERLEGKIARLEAGDLLYLPPYWFHHVESGSNITVSMNVWSNSQEYWANEALFAAPIPFESDWDVPHTLCIAIEYVEYLLNRLELNLDDTMTHNTLNSTSRFPLSASFFRLLFHSRFENTFGSIPEAHEILKYYGDCILQCMTKEISKESRQSTLERFQRGHASVSRFFDLLPSQGVKTINFTNYVESLLVMIVGPEHLHPVVQSLALHLLES